MVRLAIDYVAVAAKRPIPLEMQDALLHASNLYHCAVRQIIDRKLWQR